MPGRENGNKVMSACLILMEKNYKTKDHKPREVLVVVGKMMADPGKFLERLQQYKGEDMLEDEVEMLTDRVLNDPDFNFERINKSSSALANLANWVINIYKYNRICTKVAPLMKSLNEAKAAKAAADESLAAAIAIVAAVEEKLAKLQVQYEEAITAKQRSKPTLPVPEARPGRASCGRARVRERALGCDHSGAEEGRRHAARRLHARCGLRVVRRRVRPSEPRQAVEVSVAPDIRERGIPCQRRSRPSFSAHELGAHRADDLGSLPDDRVNIENGSIISVCKRWPLIIDPQMQGIKWIRNKEAANNLQVFQLSNKRALRNVEQALINGYSILIENIGEKSRHARPRAGARHLQEGRNYFLKLARRSSTTRTSSSTCKRSSEPALQARDRGAVHAHQLHRHGARSRGSAARQGRGRRATGPRGAVGEAAVGRDAVQDSAHAIGRRAAVARERTRGRVSDIPLIEGLEATKATTNEINAQMVIMKQTEQDIAVARESYRIMATEGAMLYFMLTKLCMIDHMYRYSLDAFVSFFYKSITKAAPAKEVSDRVTILRDSLRLTIFTWCNRGLFERHKIILCAQLCFELQRRGTLGEDNLMNERTSFIMRRPRKMGVTNPLNASDPAWQACQALLEVDDFGPFCDNLVEAAPRFREWTTT